MKRPFISLFQVLESQVTSGALRRQGKPFAVRNLLDLPQITDLAHSRPVCDLARSVLGEVFFPVRGILFEKIPAANWKVPWHQDVTIAVREKVVIEGFGPWTMKAGTLSVSSSRGSIRLEVQCREPPVTVRLARFFAPLTLGIPAQYVKPYVKTNKNDYIDAEAIAEAVGRPKMRFVPIKSEDQLDMQALHRVRESWVERRTSVINQIRAVLLERGITIRKGRRHAEAALPQILEDPDTNLSGPLRMLLAQLQQELRQLQSQIDEIDADIVKAAGEREACPAAHDDSRHRPCDCHRDCLGHRQWRRF